MKEGWITHEEVYAAGWGPNVLEWPRLAIEAAGLDPDKYTLEPLPPELCAWRIVRKKCTATSGKSDAD